MNHQPPHSQMPQLPPPCEITTIVGAMYQLQRGGDPNVAIMTFTCPNGRQYQIPIDENARKAIMKSLSGLQVFNSSDLPSASNNH